MTDELPIPRWTPEQITELNRIGADEDATEKLFALFEWVHGRERIRDTEAFEWGAKNTDATLRALGFESRARFQYVYDCTLMVEQGPRAKDRIN
jgi:hypothetical protein